jgi:hypothetical protein
MAGGIIESDSRICGWHIRTEVVVADIELLLSHVQ